MAFPRFNLAAVCQIKTLKKKNQVLSTYECFSQSQFCYRHRPIPISAIHLQSKPLSRPLRRRGSLNSIPFGGISGMSRTPNKYAVAGIIPQYYASREIMELQNSPLKRARQSGEFGSSIMSPLSELFRVPGTLGGRERG